MTYNVFGGTLRLTQSIKLKLPLLTMCLLCAVNRCEPVPRLQYAVANSQLALKDSVVNYTCVEGFVASNLSAMWTACDGAKWTSVLTHCKGRLHPIIAESTVYVKCLIYSLRYAFNSVGDFIFC